MASSFELDELADRLCNCQPTLGILSRAAPHLEALLLAARSCRAAAGEYTASVDIPRELAEPERLLSQSRIGALVAVIATTPARWSKRCDWLGAALSSSLGVRSRSVMS